VSPPLSFNPAGSRRGLVFERAKWVMSSQRVCFDTSLARGKGERRFGGPPFSARVSVS